MIKYKIRRWIVKQEEKDILIDAACGLECSELDYIGFNY